MIRPSLYLSALLLCACASPPPPPDWQASAHAALQSFSEAYLRGDKRLADADLARARAEIARTGRADLMARAELTRCAVRVASLELDDCAAYAPLAQDATPSEQAYAAYLGGHGSRTNAELLPPHHQALLSQARAAANTPGASALLAMPDPLARLIGAGVLLQSGQLRPADTAVAVDTASGQGWRRPLLAWLGVQRQSAGDAGDAEAAARIQRRIDLVLQSAPTP